jgi:O-6-methylguanine DNA methyltransferase
LDEHGQILARFCLLLVDDRLDAEDLFRALAEKLASKRPESLSLQGALRSALALVEARIRSEKKSRYRPVDVGDERVPGSGAIGPLRERWGRVPVAERSAILLVLGLGLSPGDASSLLGRRGDPFASAEHGLLRWGMEPSARGRLPRGPRGAPRGDTLRRILAGSPVGEEGGRAAARVAAELDSGIKRFRALQASILRPADWKRMRKRAFRETPVSGDGLVFDAFPTPFGWFSIAALEGTVLGTAFGRRGEAEWLRAVGPGVARSARHDPKALRGPRRELEEYFAGRRRAFTFPYRLIGATSFRASVLAACARIPFGAVRSYRQVADAAGRPGAWRAVGGALGRNPLPVVVPCHRVIAHSGFLGGFSAGLSLKEKLLSLEGMGDLFNPAS